MQDTTRHQERRFTDLPTGRTAYLTRGSGPPLVLVHGVGLNASVWAPQIEAFSEEYRVVAYDTLGHGGSAGADRNTELPRYREQLAALLDELDLDRVVLVGHSMGALITTLLALDVPQRVQCLVAANPVYCRPAAQLAASRARIRRIEAEGPAAGLDELVARWFGDPPVVEPSRVEQVRQWLGGADPRGYAEAYRVFSESDSWLAGRLAALSVPALFVTGALDPNSTPAMSRQMAAEAPQGCARVLDGERHMMAYASPARFNAVVREFLERVATEPESPEAASGEQARRA